MRNIRVLLLCLLSGLVLQEGRALLQALVSQDDWLAPAHAVPHPERYQQFLLYADPQDRFSVVSFVWGPGQSTPIHNHTVWGLVGMMRGQEGCQAYVQNERGQWVAQGDSLTLLPGQVEAVSPTIGDVHQVWNGLKDQASISIHVYGANIGKVNRNVFASDGTSKAFVSGYSNAPGPWQSPQGLTSTPATEVRSALLERREVALSDQQKREAARSVLREQRFDAAYDEWARELRAAAWVEMRDAP